MMPTAGKWTTAGFPRWKKLVGAACIAVWLTTASVGAETLEEAVRSRHFQEAVTRIQALLPEANSRERARLLLLLADCQVQLSLPEEAEKTLQSIDPRTAPFRFFRVRGQFQHLRNNDTLAEKDFEHALKIAATPEEKIQALCEMALLDSAVVEQKRAEKLWSEALELASSHSLAIEEWLLIYRTRYELLTRSGNPQEALNLCRLARKHLEHQDDKKGMVWSYLCEIKALESLGRFEQAERTWHRALEVSERGSAAVLLMWGYSTLYDRIDEPAMGRILTQLEKHWTSSSKSWSEFERYHIRMLQAQLWLHGLSRPEKALVYLRLAEPLASVTARPSGEHMTVRISHHKFDNGPSSDMEQVLWLQLRCHQRLNKPDREIKEFMKEKLELLPRRERPAWLITLGKLHLPSHPQLAEKYFSEALEGTTGDLRGRLLVEMMGTFYEYGQLIQARKKRDELRSTLSRLSPTDSLEIFRYAASQSVDRECSQGLWKRVWDSGNNRDNRDIFSGLFKDSSQPDSVESKLRQRLQENEESGRGMSLARNLYTHAQSLILRGRYAEALAVCEIGEKRDPGDGNYGSEFMQLASYALFHLGDREDALSLIGKARENYAQSDRYSSKDGEIDCVILEVGYLLDTRRFRQALELLETYQLRVEGQDFRTLALARSIALKETKKPRRALEALGGLEEDLGDSIFSVAVKSQRAKILREIGRENEMREQLEVALSLAMRLESLHQCEVVLLWRELDPESAPIDDVARRVKSLPDYHEDNPGAARVLDLAGLGSPVPENNHGRWLPRREFLSRAGELMLRHPSLATTVPLLPASLSRQSETLQPNEAKVEYYLGANELVILVVASEGFAVHQLAVKRETLEDWIEKVRTDPEAARQLGRILVDSLGPECDEKTLTILGHGPLLSMPWDLLQLGDGKLIQHHQWRLWAGPSFTRHSATSGGPYQVLALGGAKDSKLPASRREVEALAGTGVGSVKALTGEAANQAELTRLMPHADILHLATHSTATELHLSGGVLGIDSIYSLPLKPGALVVLSSCEGADPGEQERGPVNLASAFLAAGASEVIAGLDRVLDDDAEALFTEFYKGMAAGLTPSAALQKAKLTRLKANPNGDWSKFVLLGD